jgi:chromosome segregation ATPase
MSAPALRLACALAALTVLVPPAGLHAQGDDSTTRGYAPAAPSANPAPERTAAGMDALATARAILQPSRSDADVSRDIQAADLALNQADAEIAAATRHRNQAAQLVQAADRRLAELEARRKQPGATLSKAERDSLDAQRKTVSRRKGVAENLVTLADLERDAANKARAAAVARQHALEMEGLFVRKRKESGDNATSNTGAGETIRELGRETLAAQKQAAALDRDLASKRALVASKRLDLFQSYLSTRGLEDR